MLHCRGADLDACIQQHFTAATPRQLILRVARRVVVTEISSILVCTQRIREGQTLAAVSTLMTQRAALYSDHDVKDTGARGYTHTQLCFEELRRKH